MKPDRFPFKIKRSKAPTSGKLYLKLRSRLLSLYLAMVVLPVSVLSALLCLWAGNASEKAFCESSAAIFPSAESLSGQLFSGLSAFSALIADRVKNTDLIAHPSVVNPSVFFSFYEDSDKKEIEDKLESAYILSDGKVLPLYEKNQLEAVISPTMLQSLQNKAKEDSDAVSVSVRMRFDGSGKGKPVLSVVRGLPAQSSSAALVLDFDYNLLSSLTQSLRAILPAGSEMLILDSSPYIVYTEDSSLLTLAPDPSLKDLVAGLSSGDGYWSGKISYKEKSRLAVCKKFSGSSWIFLFMIPAGKVYENLFPFAAGTALPALGIFALILVLFPVLFLRQLSPIDKLTSVISGQAGLGAPLTQNKGLLPGQASDRTLDAASSDLEYLIDKVYTLNLKQREAELNALQNQINPHFLYNTLESIRGAALFHGIHDIAAMSKALSLLFRYSIDSTVLVSVKEEIQHLENYMSIQNFRYENKFELLYEIPYDFYNYKILKLSLQPLIENSIKHGLEMKLGKGTIKISMFSMDNSIRIQISDDGIGMPQKKIDELNRMLEREEYSSDRAEAGDKRGTGIGVKNVNSRIKLYFGEAYGLKFRSAPSGTLVEITLPAVRDGE